MALNTDQKASKNFKKLIGKSETTTTRDFYEEPYSGRVGVLPSQIWDQAGDIPDTAPVLAADAISGVVQYKEDLVLTAVPGTTNAFYHADLKNAIPFDYGDGTSYLYSLKDSTDATIPFGSGEWVVDPDAGVLSFYGTVPSNMPPKITFYKYVGTTGLQTGDYRDLATETANRTIYVATTGSDTTGDGSSGSPFATLLKALKDIKPNIARGVTITVEMGTGTYTITDDKVYQSVFARFSGGTIGIKPASGSEWSVAESGTMTANAFFKHTDSAKSWTTNEHRGNFLRNGAAGEIFPIESNTATELYHGGSNTFASVSITSYDILEHNVILDGVSNKTLFDGCCNSDVKFEYIKLNEIQFLDTPTSLSYTSILGAVINITIGGSYSNTKNYIQASSWLSSTISQSAMTLTSNSGAALKNTAALSFFGKDGTKATDGAIKVFSNPNDVQPTFLVTYDLGFRNFKAGFTSSTAYGFARLILSDQYSFYGTDFFVWDKYQNFQIIDDKDFGLYDSGLPPSTAYLTFNGTTEADYYINLQTGLDAELIAPDGKKLAKAPAIEDLDLRSLAIDSASRTIYLATTGDDDTGDGSSGSPFFSLHRAFKDIKPLVSATITIKANDGSYNYTGLGDLLANFQCIGDGKVVVTTNNASLDDNYQALGTPVTGTFTSNDADRPIHTDTTKSWSTDAYVGNFIKVTGVLSGGAISGANKYIPIIQNNATQLITAMWAFDNYDYGTYELVEHTVKFDLGTNDFIYSNANFSQIDCNYIDITCNSIRNNNIGTVDHWAEKRMEVLNSKIDSGFEIPAKITRSFVEVNTTSTVKDCSQVAFYSSAATSIIALNNNLSESPIMYHCTYRSTDGTNARKAIYMPGSYVEIFDAYLINLKAFVENTKGGTVNFSGKIGHDGTLPFLIQAFDRGCIIKDVYAELFGGLYALNLVDEPVTGRLTYDGTAAATIYADVAKSFNALDIAPTANKITYFSNTSIDSAPIVEVDSPTITASAIDIDCNSRFTGVFNVTLDEDITINNPTNHVVGSEVIINITQDTTGGWAITWGSYYTGENGAIPAPTGTGLKSTTYVFKVISSTKLVLISSTLNY